MYYRARRMENLKLKAAAFYFHKYLHYVQSFIKLVVFELLFLNRLTPIIEQRSLIPDHQFSFRKGHGTIKQVHRIVNCINKAIDENKFCTAKFQDIPQAKGSFTNKLFHFSKIISFQQIILYLS